MRDFVIGPTDLMTDTTFGKLILCRSAGGIDGLPIPANGAVLPAVGASGRPDAPTARNVADSGRLHHLL